MSAPIVFLDTETTSLGPDREPWEIAMIKRDPNEPGDRSLHFFVEDIDLSKADPMSLKFSRFYERHPDFAVTDQPTAIGRAEDQEKYSGPYVACRYDAMHIVHQWTRGAFIVGAVPNFDTEMLDRIMRESRLVPAWHYHLIDVENLALGWIAKTVTGADWARRWIQGGLKSDDLSRACGVEPPSDEERHTAMGDAWWCQRWYDVIMGVK